MFLLFNIIEENSKQEEIHLPLEGSTVPANVIRKILLLETGVSQYRRGFHNLPNNKIESCLKVLQPINIIFSLLNQPQLVDLIAPFSFLGLVLHTDRRQCTH